MLSCKRCCTLKAAEQGCARRTPEFSLLVLHLIYNWLRERAPCVQDSLCIALTHSRILHHPQVPIADQAPIVEELTQAACFQHFNVFTSYSAAAIQQYRSTYLVLVSEHATVVSLHQVRFIAVSLSQILYI